MNKIIITLFVALFALSVNADENIDAQFAALCAVTTNSTEMQFCERMSTIQKDREECALEEIECDKKHLRDLMALYWAVKFAEMGGLLK
jgi:hypothetical protein